MSSISANRKSLLCIHPFEEFSRDSECHQIERVVADNHNTVYLHWNKQNISDSQNSQLI
jgi:hypothetical protein